MRCPDPRWHEASAGTETIELGLSISRKLAQRMGGDLLPLPGRNATSLSLPTRRAVLRLRADRQLKPPFSP